MAAGISNESRWRAIDTPVGKLIITSDQSGVVTAEWNDNNTNLEDIPGSEDHRLLPDLAARLRAYFRAERVDFSDVLTPPGPEFHARCWVACRGIPAGMMISYAELARRAGSSHRASRAAGQAMRRNRLPVIIPCHRVIASSGQLGGYAGSVDADGESMARKRYLLDLERHQADS